MVEYLQNIEKYNFWNNNAPDLGLLRKTYTNKIFEYTGNKLIKVLIGQRRVGKSYLLRQIAAQLIQQGVKPQNTLYINKEYMEYGFLNDDIRLETFYKAYKKALKPKGKVYLFIDEIQNISGWERFVNSHAQDFADKCEVFITGSNSELLAGELATLLSGRYIKFQILPFSFAEYATIKKLKLTRSSYLKYLQEGGLPELFHLNTPEARRNYVSAVKDTVLLRDIIQRYKVKDAQLLEDLFMYLVNNVGNLFSIPNIVKYFGGSLQRKTNYETVAAYIAHMESACLIHKAERYNIKGKETLLGNCKFYVNDLAFKNYLYSGFGLGTGYILENALYLELIRAGYKVYVGYTRNKEVDFVATKADRTIYLQSAYLLENHETIEREYSALDSIRDANEKYVVSLDEIKLPNRNGVQHAQAWKISEIL